MLFFLETNLRSHLETTTCADSAFGFYLPKHLKLLCFSQKELKSGQALQANKEGGTCGNACSAMVLFFIFFATFKNRRKKRKEAETPIYCSVTHLHAGFKAGSASTRMLASLPDNFQSNGNGWLTGCYIFTTTERFQKYFRNDV